MYLCFFQWGGSVYDLREPFILYNVDNEALITACKYLILKFNHEGYYKDTIDDIEFIIKEKVPRKNCDEVYFELIIKVKSKKNHYFSCSIVLYNLDNLDSIENYKNKDLVNSKLTNKSSFIRHIAKNLLKEI